MKSKRSTAASSLSIRASSALGARFSTRSARSSRNCAARLRPKSSLCASVKISSNWSKISSGMSVLPDASRSTSSRWCRNSHSDSPLTATPACVHWPEASRRAEDRLLDLLGGLGRLRRIVEPHVDRAVALGPQPRHDARAQDRRLAEARLAEEDREQLALHAARELGDLLLAAVEIAARLLGERREAEPRMLRVDGGVRDALSVVARGVGLSRIGRPMGPARRRRHARLRLRVRRCHPLRAASRSCSRRANSGVTSPPGSRVKCTALNFSGTCASPPFVSSIVTGMMKSAPSAMLRARSIA